MKKLIFGCALMISGMIGSSAWLIAHVLLVEPGHGHLSQISFP